jgi:alpha-beta hydrolase superfamily lysophospholipase
VTEERSFVDEHGVEVFTRRWMVAEPRGLVLISHGASEHCGRYDRFAHALNAAGFAAVALDHRGHGKTAASTGGGMMGPGGGDAVVDDLHALRTAASEAAGSAVPVFLFGHSLGALIGLTYLTRHAAGLAGSVLCGFPADIDGAAALAPLLAGMSAMRDEPMTDLLGNNNQAFEPARTRYDWLSRDAEEVDRYVADPMCGDDNPLTYGFLIDLFDVVVPARAQLSSIACPVLVIAGDHDPAAGMGAHATGLAEVLAADGVRVELKLYEGARHELLNETNRDEVTADVIAWLDAHRGESAGR